MIIDEREVGNYYGMRREIVFIEAKESSSLKQGEVKVIVRFNPCGNDEVDLEFYRIYKDKTEALKSIVDYVRNTPKPTNEELGRGLNDEQFPEFKVKINASVIKLFKEAVNGTIFLPDNGIGYQIWPRGWTIDALREYVERGERGERINFPKI